MKNILGLVLGLCMLVTIAFARQEAPKRLYVVTYIDVFPAFAADAATQLKQFVTDSRKDPGSVRFEVMRDVARVNHFSIVEVWENRQAFDAHLALDHTRRFREKLQAGLGSPFDERLYNILE
ncbi:MAG: antibiotic biosynthesis monooxygenase [Bryobacterales bacterium]|nr:antibiotic biosynthesis monooxygenase [Bryobacterales bacterium]